MKDKESYVPQHWFQKGDLDMKRSEIASCFLKEIKILLSAHANRTHVILYNIDVNFFVFGNNNCSFGSGTSQNVV